MGCCGSKEPTKEEDYNSSTKKGRKNSAEVATLSSSVSARNMKEKLKRGYSSPHVVSKKPYFHKLGHNNSPTDVKELAVIVEDYSNGLPRDKEKDSDSELDISGHRFKRIKNPSLKAKTSSINVYEIKLRRHCPEESEKSSTNETLGGSRDGSIAGSMLRTISSYFVQSSAKPSSSALT